jgi:hypothetical protein
MEKIQTPQMPHHRFDQPIPSPLTFRERVELEYTSQFIPFLKHLEKTLGRDRVIELLREFAFHGVKRFADEIVKTKGKNDLSVFKEIFSPANSDLWNILTIQVVESTDQVFAIRVTECLLAQVFRQAGVAEFGSTALCCDVLFTQFVNPQIGLDLEGTLMEGKPSCMYRWYVKS